MPVAAKRERQKPTLRVKWTATDAYGQRPTPLEVTEGAAWLVNQQAQATVGTWREEESRPDLTAYNAICAWNQLQRERGGVWRRCEKCGVQRRGRPKGAPCGGCGGQDAETDS